MLTRKKNPVLRNSLIYIGTDALCRGVSFLLLPLISKYLLPDELGITANFDVLFSILALLAGQTLVNSLTYFYYKRRKEDIASLVSCILVVIFASNILFSIIIILVTGVVEEYLKIGLAFQLLVVIVVVAHLVIDLNKLIYRLQDKPYKFATFQLVQTVIYVGVQLYLVVGCEMQARGRIYSLVVANLFMFVIHFCLLLKNGYVTIHVKKGTFKELMCFGLPLLPHTLSFWLKSGLDKILLTTYCGLYVNGLYSMAMTFGSIYIMCEQAFMKAYSPNLQKKLVVSLDNQTKRSLVKQSYFWGVCFVALYFVVVAACWLIVNYVIDSKYLDCFEFIPWIMAANTIHIFYSLTIEYIYAAKKTVGLGMITFSGSLIQCIMTAVLISLLGKDGVKISIVLGSLLIMSGVWWYSNRVFPMPWFGRAK